MFTGLVQVMGVVETLGETHLRIYPQGDLGQLTLGDSVAVDGVCLTVADLGGGGFGAVVSPETLQRSTLGQGGRLVNLELSLRVGDRLGGHFVTGHVDGVGHLLGVTGAEAAWIMEFSTPPTVAPYLVAKGSIAVNGVSLTVANLREGGGQFSVAVIPHTYRTTNLQYLEPGAPVNLEGDILAKYAHKFLSSRAMEEEITLEFLAEQGY